MIHEKFANSAPVGVQGISPTEGWALVSSGEAVLLDVRTAEERAYVGRVASSQHIPWATGTAQNRNPHFVRLVTASFAKDTPLVLLCRSGKRSLAAGEALVKAGFSSIYNVDEGFEGELDDQGRRGGTGGWRLRGLPWEQD